MRNLLAVVLVLGLGYVAYTVSPNTVAPTEVQAGAGQNVSGYAWSDNIGWISFNNTSDGSATSYGVNINTTTGDFSGNAWSSNIDTATTPNQGGVGWISFDRAYTGNPPGAPYQTGVSTDPIAKADIATGNVTGWARALAACTKDPSGNLSPTPCTTDSNGGGWDGWIKLSKDPADSGSTYGVVVNTTNGRFSGYAWGGAQVDASGNSVVGGVSAIGWIKFAASGNVPASSDDATCTGVTNDYSNSGKCTYGVKGPALTPLCTSNLDCTGGNLCNISSGLCIAPGGSCSSDLNCGSGQLCNTNNICVYTGGSCTANSDCATSSGQVCNLTTSKCVAPTGGSCTTNTDCIGGQICNSTTLICVNKPKTKFWQF